MGEDASAWLPLPRRRHNHHLCTPPFHNPGVDDDFQVRGRPYWGERGGRDAAREGEGGGGGRSACIASRPIKAFGPVALPRTTAAKPSKQDPRKKDTGTATTEPQILAGGLFARCSRCSTRGLLGYSPVPVRSVNSQELRDISRRPPNPPT
ncbi:hypothetical protein MRX96_041991 [Rhipicephalus microplus]